MYIKLSKEQMKKLNTKYELLEVKVDYEKGGINYFTGGYNRRGYYIYFIPMNKHNGMVTRTIMGSGYDSGAKVLIKEANRFSKKTLEKLEKELDLESIGQFYINQDTENIQKLHRSMENR